MTILCSVPTTTIQYQLIFAPLLQYHYTTTIITAPTTAILLYHLTTLGSIRTSTRVFFDYYFSYNYIKAYDQPVENIYAFYYLAGANISGENRSVLLL